MSTSPRPARAAGGATTCAPSVPGLVTGASDDDPSGIATYSQAGASQGFGLLWTAWLTFPLMAGVQEICDRTALATGRRASQRPARGRARLSRDGADGGGGGTGPARLNRPGPRPGEAPPTTRGWTGTPAGSRAPPASQAWSDQPVTARRASPPHRWPRSPWPARGPSGSRTASCSSRPSPSPCPTSSG